jgi:phosphoribosyl 1,2-cyclic phosphate phosphodiesterase
MIISGHFLLLGTGGSMGIPLIGCHCAVCLSSLPYNKRLRSSALCIIGGRNILIDCGPDFRQQALLHNINQLDAVIFTHSHNDHMAGVDDLKVYSFRNKKPLDCLLSKETYAELKKRFYYIFNENDPYAGLTPRFNLHYLEKDRGELVFQQLHIRYFSYEQMGMRVHGFRFGNLAYVSDIRIYPETIFEDLQGVETLVLSALRHAPTPMHFHVDEAVDFAVRVGAKKSWLMHVAHELDHEKTNAYLPENIQMAYDGLKLDFQADFNV